MLPLVKVTVTAYDQNGSPVSGARVLAKLDRTEFYQGFVVPEELQAFTDKNGVAILNLFPNELGSNGSQYRIRIWNPDTGQKFLDAMAVVPNQNSHLQYILQQEPFPPLDASQQALIAAQQALAPVTAKADEAAASAAAAASSASMAQASASSAQSEAAAALGSATAAQRSAADALVSKQAAAESASTALTHRDAAQASAAAAANSAIAASTSASQAATSASAASAAQAVAQAEAAAAETSSAVARDWAIKTDAPVSNGLFGARKYSQDAQTSANAASASAVDAANSAASALASANAAAVSEANAANSATAAAASESNAAASASAAAASASAAASSASNAGTSASQAATSAANAATSADRAATSATTATNAASAATAASAAINVTANVSAWVSGTNYAVGTVVYSPSNWQNYRRKVAGAGTTDPSQDPKNWEAVGFGPVNIGTAPNQVPLNGYLGTLAYQDRDSVNIGGGVVTAQIRRLAPVTKTANFTVADTEHWIICNGTGAITVTLPNAGTNVGREIMIKTIAAQSVVSASSNVVPLDGSVAGTAILAATAGKFATLVSDGTNWVIMQAN